VTRDEILKWAAFHRAEVVDMELPSQFRRNGSDGYLAWLDHLLQIRVTANESLAGIDYDFRVCDSPTESRDLTLALDQGYDRDSVDQQPSVKKQPSAGRSVKRLAVT